MDAPRDSRRKVWLSVAAASTAFILSIAYLVLWRTYGERSRLILAVGWLVVSVLLAGQAWRTRNRP